MTLKHTPTPETAKAMQASFDLLPSDMSGLDLTAYIHGVLEGFNITPTHRLVILHALVSLTDDPQDPPTRH